MYNNIFTSVQKRLSHDHETQHVHNTCINKQIITNSEEKTNKQTKIPFY